MRELINKLCWCLHRMLCYLKLHAPGRLSIFDTVEKKIKRTGWYCVVCTKTWEKK